jgi:hypothetical protein
LVREAPLSYVIHSGRVVVTSGYGRGGHWFRNAMADPDVEVVLPGAVILGRAEEITDPVERREAFRRLLVSQGVIGRLLVGDVAGMSDARVDELTQAFPLLAIRPTALQDGPFDTSGTFHRVAAATSLVTVAVTAVTTVVLGRHCRRRTRPTR